MRQLKLPFTAKIIARQWRRYLPAALAITFCSLLITIQGALLLGMFGAVSVVIDTSSADIWASYPGAATIDMARPISLKNDVFLRMSPKVEKVESLVFADGDWRREDGSPFGATLIGIDTTAGSMGLANVIGDSLREKLLEPQSVLISRADRGKLEADLNSRASLNGQTARIVGIVEGNFRSSGGIYVITSLASIRKFLPNGNYDENTSFFLVKTKKNVSSSQTVQELQPNNYVNPYTLRTADEFSKDTQSYWLFESGSGLGYLFSSTLSLLVGILITSQTLSSVIISSQKEFATLRAIGVPSLTLKKIALEQALILGLFGVFVSSSLAIVIVFAAKCFDVSISLPFWLIGVSAVIALLVAILAGLFSMRSFKQIQPLNLIRQT